MFHNVYFAILLLFKLYVLIFIVSFVNSMYLSLIPLIWNLEYLVCSDLMLITDVVYSSPSAMCIPTVSCSFIFQPYWGDQFSYFVKTIFKVYIKLNSLFWCIVLSPDKHILPCSHHDYQETECFYHSKNLPHDSL